MTTNLNYPALSKQYVIDNFVVGYGSKYHFKLSVIPVGFDPHLITGGMAELTVSVNGKEVKHLSKQVNGFYFELINNSVYVNLAAFLTELFKTEQTLPPVVVLRTYTRDTLPPAATGYFEIPQQLEANPSQLEIGEVSGSDLAEHFSSIIHNQKGFTGVAFGGKNNYRDSPKNNSVGEFILQNTSPTLKAMLISSSEELDIIASIRFSQDEYTKFKNKYLKTALQYINQNIDPTAYNNNTLRISGCVDSILTTINIAKEFSNSFAYSYMVANGLPTYSENVTVPSSGLVYLTNYISLDDPANALYLYNVTGIERLLLAGVDYSITTTDLLIGIQFNTDLYTPYVSGPTTRSFGQIISVDSTDGLEVGMSVFVSSGIGEFPLDQEVLITEIDTATLTFTVSVQPTIQLLDATIVAEYNIYAACYTNPSPAYIPSTPSKVGTFGTYVPRVELDKSYAIPTHVIVGHDGSRSIIYGTYDPITKTFSDYRDDLLLELETRIYNLIPSKFRDQYFLPLRLETVKSGYFRKTQYSRLEFLNITEQYLNKWASKNKANYRINEWATSIAESSIDPSHIWKLYNYTDAKTLTGDNLHLPGNWRGIFLYYYDTLNPDTCPWEMLGMTTKPGWWETEYGVEYGTSNTQLWDDLTNGIIRQGPSAIIDPITAEPLPQQMWARPGLLDIAPVDTLGNLRTVVDIFHISVASIYSPFDGFDKDWVYGDVGPVEHAWMSTSGYTYSVQEFLYLMKPGPFGELLWDTVGTERPTRSFDIYIPWDTMPSDTTSWDISSSKSNNSLYSRNWQYVQNDVYTNEDPLFYWMRPKNVNQYVHGEYIDSVLQIRFGYQRWISDRILFFGKDVTSTFGQKIRSLDVNLANKLAGFTNKDTTMVYLESASTGAKTTNLAIPSNNFSVELHTGRPNYTYSYSGVIVRALADGTFAVYGYDLINPSFLVQERSNAQLIDVTIGGTPSPFKIYNLGETYYKGDIVRYNGIFYLSMATQLVGKFNAAGWQKLKALPIQNGVSVVYRPISNMGITKIPYGTILKSPQEVFDLLIGWGAYLEGQGWQFKEVSKESGQLSDWLYSAKQFLFWLNTNWGTDSIIQLSPAANNATLIVNTGYPNDVETISNGVYSILDKYGVAISPNNTITNRDGKLISVMPVDSSISGIYYLKVNTTETEHALVFDNVTSFNDLIYSPLLRSRQQRLKFSGFRSNGWYGKMEAPGYLVIGDKLVPNFNTVVESIRYFYDANTTIDNASIEDLGRHLIGFENKDYLDNLQVSNDIQYLFYRGSIKEKGTEKAFNKLFRSTTLQNNAVPVIYEEWALKSGNFGNVLDEVAIEYILTPEQNTGEVVVARMNYIPSKTGHVKKIQIINAVTSYTTVPTIQLSAPTEEPLSWVEFSINSQYFAGTSVVRYFNSKDSIPTYYRCIIDCVGILPTNLLYWEVELKNTQATAYAVLDEKGIINRIDISNSGSGYLTSPSAIITSTTENTNLDSLYAIWQGDIEKDVITDNIIDIDVDDVDTWIRRPTDYTTSLKFPTTSIIDYALPNAGYVNFKDVIHTAYDVTQLIDKWQVSSFNPIEGDSIWVAKNFIEDWNVYKLVAPTTAFSVDVFNGSLLLSTNLDLLITPQLTKNGYVTDLGNLIVLQVVEARAIATVTNLGGITIDITSSGANYITPPIITITAPSSLLGHAATATAIVSSGKVTDIVITDPGSNYTIDDVIKVDIAPPRSLNNTSNYIVGVVYDHSDSTRNYYSLVSLTGTQLTQDDLPEYSDFTKLLVFKTLRFRIATGYAVLSNNKVKDIAIFTEGEGYNSAPTVTIRGDGENATATANVIDGKVKGIYITNHGSGYTYATIEFSAPYNNYLMGEDKVWLDKDASLCEKEHSIVCSWDYTNDINENTVSMVPWDTDESDTLNWEVLLNPNLVPWDTDESDTLNWEVLLDPNDMVLRCYAWGTFRWDVPVVEQAWIKNKDLAITLSQPITTWGTFPWDTGIFDYTADAGVTWASKDNDGWVVNKVDGWSTSSFDILPWENIYAVFRKQESLIDTSLFSGANIYSTTLRNELALLPLYDPFKNILPAMAKQNISYTTHTDPARYNVTGNSRLFSANVIFGESHVGKLWWDLSTIRYTYYEQPIALDNSETFTDNLIYRRDWWGQLFPGSRVDIYEWVRSAVPPESYNGTGTVRNISDYVIISSTNVLTGILELTYYFWVLNTTNKPNLINRTLSALEVANMLSVKKSYGGPFYAPIQQTAINNSYMVCNAQEILAYKGNTVQIKYNTSANTGKKHTQWQFIRAADPASIISDQYWDKLTDSLCGYTGPLSTTGNWNNSIIIGKHLHWDIGGWNISLWDEDDELSTTDYTYCAILPVPDPLLSTAEKYGIDFRPRQGMFVDVYAARKIFTQSVNSLLSSIPIRGTYDSTISTYCYYKNWYAENFEGAVPTVPPILTYELAWRTVTTNEAYQQEGTIIKVLQGEMDVSDTGEVTYRYKLYNVVKDEIYGYILVLIGIELSVLQVSDTLFTDKSIYLVSSELRTLMSDLRNSIFIKDYKIHQNDLYFSMLNYVYSEQKETDWAFKSSYIYVKEKSSTLGQPAYYIPDQTDNIISYITDIKPYHTHIREYAKTYNIFDLAAGIPTYTLNNKITIKFEPQSYDMPYLPHEHILTATYGWDFSISQFINGWDTFNWDAVSYVPDIHSTVLIPWDEKGQDTTGWEVEQSKEDPPTLNNVINQYVSGNNALPADPSTTLNPKLYSVLIPNIVDKANYKYPTLVSYRFTSLTINDPQSFTSASDIIAINVNGVLKSPGHDYFVEYNGGPNEFYGNTPNSYNDYYSIYFFNSLPNDAVIRAYVMWNGGNLLSLKFDSYRNEIAVGTPEDGFVVNVDTRLPANKLDGELTPYVTWGEQWDTVSDSLAETLNTHNITTTIPWDIPLSVVITDATISYKENTSTSVAHEFYRNSASTQGVITNTLLAPTSVTDNLQSINVYVSSNTDILPTPTTDSPGVIWINGERIEYETKIKRSSNTWTLKTIRRGTHGTAPNTHAPSSKVWVEKYNDIPIDSGMSNQIACYDVNCQPWNVVQCGPDYRTVVGYGNNLWDTFNWDIIVYTDINSTWSGGLWYSNTAEAEFLRAAPGIAIS